MLNKKHCVPKTPGRQNHHLKINENKEFLRVPPSHSVVAEECMRLGLHLQRDRGEQGVVPPCSQRLNRYGGIPLQHKCSENKDEAYTVVNRKILIFPDRGVFLFPDLKHRLLIFTVY